MSVHSVSHEEMDTSMINLTFCPQQSVFLYRLWPGRMNAIGIKGSLLLHKKINLPLVLRNFYDPQSSKLFSQAVFYGSPRVTAKNMQCVFPVVISLQHKIPFSSWYYEDCDMTIENILCLVVEWYIGKTDYSAEISFLKFALNKQGTLIACTLYCSCK